ncbi:hypothetical protein SAMN05660464_3503 [Geodermatophilus dictyosporus]|uniref:Uncharacterized protein n=1 Tax=Geodermatophilus dictyosporus TaxID=1523247 RepID=A0A1I5R698_9ACTN|nr:hypothetical protein [Geodermatophilus dictyosporus]SFP53975.1 hypothetical protein SAMN05660464_3503 [Geodermatophilus dictyosporus]
MFRVLARLVPIPANVNPPPTRADVVFALHPLQLSRWLEEIWGAGGAQVFPPVPGAPVPPALGAADVVQRLRLADVLRNQDLRSGVSPGLTASGYPSFDNPVALGAAAQLPWEHLIYPYLVESTGVLSVLTEVVRRYVTGETLDPPSVQTLVWARTTEELFLRDAPLFSVGGLTSAVRPDAAVNRRNAYWRMFGVDLPHPLPGHPDGTAWKQPAGATVNTRFLETWHELLRQVWLGIENNQNQVGANPTDPSHVAYLCQTIGELLRLRRRGGLLSREEFSYSAMLSWFHLTVEQDSAVVRDLRATAGGGGVLGNPADRLALIAARVGMTPPRAARELFELADLMSPLMWFIELGTFDNTASARLLFDTQGQPNTAMVDLMTRIVDLWQSATGVWLKKEPGPSDRASARGPAPVQQVRMPGGIFAAPPAPPAPVPNGSGPGGTVPAVGPVLNGAGAPAGVR